MKILFLQKRPLFPADSGGKIRTLNILRHLARWHDVTYLCNFAENERKFLPKMADLGLELETIPWREASRHSWRFYGQLATNVLSRHPFNVAKDYDRRLRRRAEELLAENDYDLIICDFVQMARNAIGLTGPPKLLFQHNVEAEIFARHAKTGGSWALRQYMHLQYRKMRRFEAKAGRDFDAVVAVSDRDKQTFQADYGWDHVHTIDTAVDLDYFQRNGTEERPDQIMFLGAMDWLPNEDCAEYFVREVWPIVRNKRPNVTFQIVGRNPTPLVRQLNSATGVEVVGTVPDVRPYLAESSVVVVPLRIGGGTRIKIFEAMAMGKTVVSTTLGAEGLNVTSGHDIEIADTPNELADAVLRLLDSPDLRTTIGANARELVEQHYSAEKIARQFEEICQIAVTKGNRSA